MFKNTHYTKQDYINEEHEDDYIIISENIKSLSDIDIIGEKKTEFIHILETRGRNIIVHNNSVNQGSQFTGQEDISRSPSTFE